MTQQKPLNVESTPAGEAEGSPRHVERHTDGGVCRVEAVQRQLDVPLPHVPWWWVGARRGQWSPLSDMVWVVWGGGREVGWWCIARLEVSSVRSLCAHPTRALVSPRSRPKAL